MSFKLLLLNFKMVPQARKAPQKLKDKADTVLVVVFKKLFNSFHLKFNAPKFPQTGSLETTETDSQCRKPEIPNQSVGRVVLFWRI